MRSKRGGKIQNQGAGPESLSQVAILDILPMKYPTGLIALANQPTCRAQARPADAQPTDPTVECAGQLGLAGCNGEEWPPAYAGRCRGQWGHTR
mmetsp:Transcript_108027/g.186423  ORF Transcript_108027/g.186423 Transcript_108027/m.186423 type:complete len:94 (-) Transcript_108027:532-813(-)